MKRRMAGNGLRGGSFFWPGAFLRRLRVRGTTALAMRFPIDSRGSSVLVSLRPGQRLESSREGPGPLIPSGAAFRGPLIEDPWGSFVES